MRFGQRKVKDVDGRERPMWRTRWWVPDGRRGDQPHPPLLLVFNRIGPRNPGTVTPVGTSGMVHPARLARLLP
ncbi:hypothetical protein [Streptomyces sp. NPDC001480]|uniref:hypothetical protein n=1 Tax=Streptomyces sp. NPDC001480 TaxID=3364577 RepID=UPI00368A9ADB